MAIHRNQGPVRSDVKAMAIGGERWTLDSELRAFLNDFLFFFFFFFVCISGFYFNLISS